MGKLSQKHKKNRSRRYEAQKRHRDARRLVLHWPMHARHGQRTYRWTTTPDDLARLAAYNDDHELSDWWWQIIAEYRRFKGYAPLTANEAERAYDEAKPVPISPEQIERMVRHATTT